MEFKVIFITVIGFFFFLRVWFIYSVVLVSGVEQSDSVILKYIYIHTYIYIYIYIYIYTHTHTHTYTISFIFILFIWLCRGLSCGRWDLQSLVAAWELLIETRGIHFPDQGLNPDLGPLPWECGVLATRPPGNSLSATSCQNLTLKCYME